MRISSLLLFLPALTVAEQNPLGEQLKGWVEKAKSFIPSSPSAPIDAGAAKVASHNVVSLNKDNWVSELSRKPGASTTEEWMVLISGGNKTCYGRCDRLEQAWNESVALLSADPTSPKLGYVNCDKAPMLCGIWIVGPPTVWYFEIPPQAEVDGKQTYTDIHIISLNTSTVSANDITEIHTKKTFKDIPTYEGFFHPFDGLVAQLGLLTPVGYILYAFGAIPSWLMMVAVSFLSRTFMSRRLQPNPGRPDAPAAGAN